LVKYSGETAGMTVFWYICRFSEQLGKQVGARARRLGLVCSGAALGDSIWGLAPDGGGCVIEKVTTWSNSFFWIFIFWSHLRGI